ncbi:MAG: carotenoid biosynthesis protein [Tunicatimonas sp.]
MPTTQGEWQRKKPTIPPRGAAIFLIVTHAAGVIGLLSSARPLFQWATPFHLLLTTAVLLYFHRDWRPSFGWFIGAVMLIGYWIEVLGVHTSLIFGSYAYGPTLGAKVLEVPLMIAVNWLLLTYLCGSVADTLPMSRIAKVVSAALLMVAIDYLIEPVAIKFDFWSWELLHPPLHNYLGWLFTALLVQSLFFVASFRKGNPLALPLLTIQVLFFLVLQPQ